MDPYSSPYIIPNSSLRAQIAGTSSRNTEVPPALQGECDSILRHPSLAAISIVAPTSATCQVERSPEISLGKASYGEAANTAVATPRHTPRPTTTTVLNTTHGKREQVRQELLPRGRPYMAPSRTRAAIWRQRWWWTWTRLVLVAGSLEVPAPKVGCFGWTQPQSTVQLPSVRRWMETGDRNDGGQLLDESTLPWELRHCQGGTECSQFCETLGTAAVEITEGDAPKGSSLGLLGARNASGICKGARPPQGRTDQTYGRDPRTRSANPGSICTCATYSFAPPAWSGPASPASVGRRHGDRRGAYGRPNEARAGKNPWPSTETGPDPRLRHLPGDLARLREVLHIQLVA